MKFYQTEFRQTNTVILYVHPKKRRQSKGVVAVARSEAWVSFFLASFYVLEKRQKRSIKTPQRTALNQ